MERVGYFLGDQGGVAAGAVDDDDEINLDPGLYGFVHDFCRILDDFRIQHAQDHFVKLEGPMSQEQT